MREGCNGALNEAAEDKMLLALFFFCILGTETYGSDD